MSINLEDCELLTIFVVSSIVILGLLALMIGFSFAIALSRFEARRDAVLNEANAIGTTASRARLLPAPYDAEALKSLRDYVQLRLDLTQRVASASDVKAAIGRSNEIQETLWRNAVALAAKDTGMVPTGLFIQSLNEMIDNQGKHLEATRSRVPNIVFVALYGVAVVARQWSIGGAPGMATSLRHGSAGLGSYTFDPGS
jgi:hypothetical protein